MKRVVVDASLVGKTVALKAVTVGTTVAAASPVSLTITGEELKCYAPTSVAGTRDGGNNLTATWIRRTRAGGAWADLADVDQPETTLAYEVDFLSGVTVVRTKSITAEIVTYSAAEQSLDGLSPGSPVTVRIYQLGKLGRGYPKEATV